MLHAYTIILLFSTSRFIMIDSETTEMNGEAQTFYFLFLTVSSPFGPWLNGLPAVRVPSKEQWRGNLGFAH